jgi:hypothetical protein
VDGVRHGEGEPEHGAECGAPSVVAPKESRPRLPPAAPPRVREALEALKSAVRNGDNAVAVLMDAARVCSLRQITEAFFEPGGQYRRCLTQAAGPENGLPMSRLWP